MWSPPTRAPANADEDDDTGDDRPYFHSELSDLTLAPDLYTYHRDGHNVMKYKVRLGTEKLLFDDLRRQNELTLAAKQPAAIPRWFTPGYAHTEAKEAAVITAAHGIRTARADRLDHPDWITRTSPQDAPASPSASTPPSPSPSRATRSRLPCFLAITDGEGPRRSSRTATIASTAALPPPPGHAAPPPPPPPVEITAADAAKYRGCWEQLCHTNIRKADTAVAWRALHCQLRTPSFLTYCRYRGGGTIDMAGDTPMEQACCRWPACREPRPATLARPASSLPTTIATTSHVLLACPLTRPAALWLCDLWAAIDAGNSPPPTPDVIIAGDPTAWWPDRLDVDLWTRLRVIYLQKAWDAHCAVHHGGPTPSPTSIAAATLHSAIQAMRTEFTAAYTAPAELAQQCEAHMTGANQRQSRDDAGDAPSVAFHRIWTRSGLCTVVDGRLTVRWTTTHPVPLPPAHAQPAAAPPPPPPEPAPAAVAPPPQPPLPRLHLI